MASWYEDGFDRAREQALDDRLEEFAEETIELEDIDAALTQRDTQESTGK